MNDHEDDKAKFYVAGFENCVKWDMRNVDRLIVLFDIVGELRMTDLERLNFHYSDQRNNNLAFTINEELKSYMNYIDGKLCRMGLIETDPDSNCVIVNFARQVVLQFIGEIE